MLVVLAIAAPARALDTGAPIARKVISAWEEGTRGVVAIPAGQELREGQEFPVTRRDEMLGIFTLYYIGEFNAWGAFSATDPEVKLREGDTVMVFKSAAPERRPAPPKIWKGRVRYGIPAGMTVLSFVEGGAAEGIKPGAVGKAFIGDEPAGTYLVINVGEHYSTGMLERIMSEERAYDEFTIRFERKEE